MRENTRSFPLFQGLAPGKANLSADVLAGVTLAALAIPEVMGYTKISGTPVITGLYTMLIPAVLYALFGSSRRLVVGADSATAAILAAGIAGMAAPRSDQWLALAEVLALMSAAFLFLARVTRLGFLANFLSRTVLIGFLSGVGVQVALGQLPEMLGLPEGGHGFVEKWGKLFQNLDKISWTTLGLSMAVVVLILGTRRFSKRIPGAMIAIGASIVAAWGWSLQNYGISVLGPIPTGLPQISWPQVAWSWTLIQDLLPTAFAMFVVILTQSAATSTAYAERYGESFDQNTDLVGLGLANIGAALSGTFVVNGSPTKTQMVTSAGGSSQWAQITAALVVVLVLFFLTGPLTYLPTAALATVVFLIGLELVDARGLRRIFVERPYEFWVATVTALSVVLLGVETAIILAIILSLVVHTRHGYLVKNVVLADGPQGWYQSPIITGRQTEPGLVIYRFLHNMYYANSRVLREDLRSLAEIDGLR